VNLCVISVSLWWKYDSQTQIVMVEAMSRDINEITHAVIGAAIEVHRQLGPWLLESAYLEWPEP